MTYGVHMKRTTVLLPDELAELLDQERVRRDVSAATIVREALAQFLLAAPVPRKLKIAALGQSDGTRSLGAEAEEILAEEWGSEAGLSRLMYGTETPPSAGIPERARATPKKEGGQPEPVTRTEESLNDQAPVAEATEIAPDVEQHVGGR